MATSLKAIQPDQRVARAPGLACRLRRGGQDRASLREAPGRMQNPFDESGPNSSQHAPAPAGAGQTS